MAEAAGAVEAECSGGDLPQSIRTGEEHRGECRGQPFGGEAPALRPGLMQRIDHERQRTGACRYDLRLLRKLDELRIQFRRQDAEAQRERVDVLVEADQL